MEYLLKLTVIIMLLHIGPLQLMHFNDLHLCLDVSPYSLIQLYLNVNFCGEYLLIANSHLTFDLLSIYKKNLMFALRFGCFSLWYMKSSQQNDMKFTVFTKLSLRMLYMKFLSNQRL